MAQWQKTRLPVQKMPVRSLGGKIPWKRKWQPLVFLPGECHGQRSLVGCSSWGGRESDMTEQLNNNRKDKGPAGQPQFTCPHAQLCRRWDSAPPRSFPQRGSPDPHPVGLRQLLPPHSLPESTHVVTPSSGQCAPTPGQQPTHPTGTEPEGRQPQGSHVRPSPATFH